MFRAIEKKIISKDEFGQKVEFQFNNAGPEHKTCLGGSVTTLIKILYLIYTCILVKKFWLHEDDDITFLLHETEFDDIEAVGFKETESNMFISLVKSTTQEQLKYNATIQQFIKLEAVHLSYDGVSDIPKNKSFEPRECIPDDF